MTRTATVTTNSLLIASLAALARSWLSLCVVARKHAVSHPRTAASKSAAPPVCLLAPLAAIRGSSLSQPSSHYAAIMPQLDDSFLALPLQAPE
jgi:hypothetical protein